jgi:hypothetical protein
MHRRHFLSATAATAGALLVSRAAPTFAQSGTGLGATDAWGTPRASKLAHGLTLAHADLHNHTLFSDGDGRAEDAFATMRANNLDVACVTDHAVGEKVLQASGCGCSALGIDEAEWARWAELADAQDDPDGGFVAFRGFEWSASVPETGHMNVWFSSTWTDPVATGHAGQAGGSQFIGAGMAEELGGNAPAPLDSLFGEAGHTIARQGSALERANPANIGAMAGMYEWLQADPARPVLGGGADGIAGFNHPGREPGRFGQFAYDPAVADRIVSLEVFNRRDDYLFEGIGYGNPSPIVQCLNAGWKVGLNGVTDEHGTDWGAPLDKGRCGLWLPSFDRAGIKAALQRRRFFATNRRGLRLDVQARDLASGTRAFMGEDLVVAGRDLLLTIDVDGNDPTGVDAYRGRTVNVQVCTQGDVMPTVVTTRPFTVPGPDEPPIALTVDVGESPYVFVRITDPARPEQGEASLPVAAAFSGVGGAIAYSSPVFLSR